MRIAYKKTRDVHTLLYQCFNKVTSSSYIILVFSNKNPSSLIFWEEIKAIRLRSLFVFLSANTALGWTYCTSRKNPFNTWVDHGKDLKTAGPHNCPPTSPNFSCYPRCSARPTMVPLARAYLLAASSVPPAEMAVNFLYRGPLPGPATEKHENQLENGTTEDQVRTSSSDICNGQDFTAPCLAYDTRYALGACPPCLALPSPLAQSLSASWPQFSPIDPPQLLAGCVTWRD
jgi:hypothetical protein